MFRSLILFSVVAYVHAKEHTIVYAGKDAESMLAGRGHDHTFMIPAGECKAYFPLEMFGCPDQLGKKKCPHNLMVDVEDEAKAFVKIDDPIKEINVTRRDGKCGMPATVKVTKKCNLKGMTGPPGRTFRTTMKNAM